ncbi:MAG: cellulose synthase/poly-beta-1,6-N-acetylglucosamine synthase-like glycosyltransferase [Afipia broomeae]|jgi:cellulose synthase/poly-beta-1,6-N-acetylglucosamine synthase-like glycosyltransferase
MPALVVAHVYYLYHKGLQAALGIRGAPFAYHSGWEGTLPMVSVIIAAHDQEDLMGARLANIAAQDYPQDRIEIIVAADGCTDRTVEIAQAAGARLLEHPTQIGKSPIQNEAMQIARGSFFVFTGTRSSFEPDFLRKVIDAFADPGVGAVDGHLRYQPSDKLGLGESQGTYWRMELAIRQLESQLGQLLVCSGACVATRKEATPPFPEHIGEDCVIPLAARRLGYYTVHLPEAIAYDRMKSDYEAELAARIRMTLRNWQGTLLYPDLINPLRSPLSSFVLFSHKLLRWMLPYIVLVSFVATVILAMMGNAFGFLALFGYAATLLLVVAAWCDAERQQPGRLSALWTFAIANWGFAIALARAFRNEKTNAYHK